MKLTKICIERFQWAAATYIYWCWDARLMDISCWSAVYINVHSEVDTFEIPIYVP